MYDSSGAAEADAFYSQMLTYVDEEHQKKRGSPFDFTGWESKIYIGDCPQQNNIHDCGVFTAQFMRCLALRERHDADIEFDFDQSDMPYLRKRMILDILNKEILGEAAVLTKP